jgi:hypothetical protein
MLIAINAAKLKSIMAHSFITPWELANDSKISAQSLYGALAKGKPVTPVTMRKLLDGLNLSVEQAQKINLYTSYYGGRENYGGKSKNAS